MTDTAKLLTIQQRETDYASLYKTLKEEFEAPSSKALFDQLSGIRKARAQKLRELTAYDLTADEHTVKNVIAYRRLLKDSGFMKRLATAEKNISKEYKAMTEEYPSFAAFSEEAAHSAELLLRESGKMYTEEYLPVGRIKEYVMTFEQPDRPVIVYLHGGPGESVIPFAGFLASGIDFATVIFYDQRGTGRTQLKNNSSSDSITFGALLTDLRCTISQIRKKYGVDKVILMGHSWGTVLGTQYALRYPEDLHCYIGVGQVVDFRDGERMCLDITKERMGTPDEEDQRILDKLGSYPDNLDRKNVLKMILTARTLERKYKTAANTDGIREIMKESGTFSWKDIPGMLSLKKNINLMRFLISYDISESTEYNVPVFYILGREDHQVPSQIASEYFERISAPDKKLFWIEDAGHLPNITKPAEFNEALKEITEKYA